jgi:hypothetical protein
MNALSRWLVATRLCFFSLVLRAQTDTEFWFAAPDLQQTHNDRPIFIRAAAGDLPATVTISQPANPGFPIQTFTVPANAAFSYDLSAYIATIECGSVNQTEKKALLVRSDVPISCYYDIANTANGDMFALKGSNALGNAFTVAMQMELNNWRQGVGGFTADVIILATEDNTTIDITPRTAMQGIAAGQTVQVNLNRGETYMIRSGSHLGIIKPGGTKITSNKPVAVTTKDDSIELPGLSCGDTAGDQLIPDRLAGIEFIVLRGYLYAPPTITSTRPDLFFVFAIQDGTTINTSNGGTKTINAGDYYAGTLNEESVYIVASKPVHVFQGPQQHQSWHLHLKQPGEKDFPLRQHEEKVEQEGGLRDKRD